MAYGGFRDELLPRLCSALSTGACYTPLEDEDQEHRFNRILQPLRSLFVGVSLCVCVYVGVRAKFFHHLLHGIADTATENSIVCTDFKIPTRAPCLRNNQKKKKQKPNRPCALRWRTSCFHHVHCTCVGVEGPRGRVERIKIKSEAPFAQIRHSKQDVT